MSETIKESEYLFETKAEGIPARLRVLADNFVKTRSKRRVGELMCSLANDIENDKNLNGWNRLNLPEEVEAMTEQAWYSRVVVRFGMFIPIVLSWWSIQRATNEYALLSKSQLFDNSFLYWWVQGMDGKLRWIEKLPNAAMVTAGTIAMIGMSGLVAGVPNARLRKDINREMQRAQIYIGQNVGFTPEQMRGAVTLLLKKMVDAGKTLDSTTTASLEVIRLISEQFETLKTYVEQQSSLVGGDLKASVELSTNAWKALTKSLDANQLISAALSDSSQTFRDSVVPINDMIRSANSLTTSAVTASSTLHEMVERVPGSFHEPIGAMISAGEFLGDAVAKLSLQMASLDSLFAAIGHTRGAAEIQTLLQRIEVASERVALGQNSLSNQVGMLEQNFEPIWRGVELLSEAIHRLTNELNMRQPPSYSED